jgi:acyl-CoA thioesterase I
MRAAFKGLNSFGYGAICGLRNLCLGLILGAGAAHAETVTIAALGDSLTEGYGLPASDGFVPQLQGWLQAQGAEVTLINAGVSGDTTAGGLSRVAWTLTPDVDALIVALGGNDFLRGIDPAASRANLSGILEAAQAQGVPVLLVGLQATGNYGADFKTAFDSMYPDLATEFGAGLFPSFFQGIMDAGGDARDAYFQDDGIHPNAEGVKLEVAAMGPAVLDLIEKVE